MTSCKPPCWRSPQAYWRGISIALTECRCLARIWECRIRGRWALVCLSCGWNRVNALDGFFYCTLVKRQIVMLHQFVKKTDKTPPKELTIALKRMKEWKDADS